MKLIVLLPINVRSGLEFFQSLLDGHDQIAQLPGSFYVDEFLTKIRKIKNLDLIAHTFIDTYSEYFDSRLNSEIERHDRLGVNKNEFYIVNKVTFINCFKRILKHKKCSNQNIIKAINLAYANASGKDISKIKIIILQLHHLHRLHSIKNFEFDLVFTCRHPASSFSSYIDNLAYFKKKIPLPWPFYYNSVRINDCFDYLEKIEKKSFLIKLEDLHLNNEVTMKSFCKIFDLEFKKSMTLSTFHNKLWWGDAVSKRDLNGVNINFKNKINHKNFFKKDLLIIEKKYSFILNNYQYQKSFNDKNILKIYYFLPFKFELIIFFKNLINFKIKNTIMSVYYFLKRLLKMKKLKTELTLQKI